MSYIPKYSSVERPEDQVLCTYIWIDGTGQSLRAKRKVVSFVPTDPSELPIWSSDGSSCGFGRGTRAPVYLKPVALYRDPFHGKHDKLVLCETVNLDLKATPFNTRRSCLEVIDLVTESHNPWFGIEQEYVLMDTNLERPYGWPEIGYPEPQGPYYCGVGDDKVKGRKVVEAHMEACLYAGISICGENAEVMLAQWEYQIGPCKGISIGDDLWMSRFILHRVAEDFHVAVSLDPKPVPGDWNGSGAHTNFSTKQTRAPGGLQAIEEAIEKLKINHKEHIYVYDPNGGQDNKRRLTGKHETARIDQFNCGVDDRGTSVRIPGLVARDGHGYLEDRRPSSNCDPYRVAEAIVRTVCLSK